MQCSQSLIVNVSTVRYPSKKAISSARQMSIWCKNQKLSNASKDKAGTGYPRHFTKSVWIMPYTKTRFLETFF